MPRADFFDDDAYDEDAEEIAALNDAQVEKEIDAFVAIVTSPDRSNFVETLIDEAFLTRHSSNEGSEGDSPTLASRPPVWNGSVVEGGVCLGDDFMPDGVKWKQVGRKVSHESIRES